MLKAVAVGPVKKGDSQLKEPQRWKAFSENKSHLDQIDPRLDRIHPLVIELSTVTSLDG
jgi:hypothetical protein